MINKMLKEADSDDDGSGSDSGASEDGSESEEKPHQIRMRFDTKSKKAS